MIKVDERDRRILRYLVQDARQSVAALARRLGLSESGVRRRINRLLRNGVIRNFTVAIDYEKAGYPITVIVGVNVGGMPGPEAASKLRAIEDIVDVFTVTGEFDLILRIICSDIQEFEKIIERIRNFEFIEQTRSFVVLNKMREGNFKSIIKLGEK
jgi:DNA-binding Lrp family transcriptional regulator